ncbi:BCCT family transporter [Jannaschia sp. LMIT008]|uniref:BCCT family transporter n=1 Tax=Jannaschia maritima TaxID=3032585 RepID=UPI002810BB96|nr:BCCT family transporter [Jannaschia sp. LMIT008]
MAQIEPPLTDLEIHTHDGGFYNGFATRVAIPAKVAISVLILWAIVDPDSAGTVLTGINGFILQNFATWYIYVMGGFVLTCLLLAVWPGSGSMRLGKDTDRPEFDNFSWFSMMFGAGIGVGMLTWAVAEPIYHFQNNPRVIAGLTAAASEDNVLSAYTYSFLHWGFSAWSSYAIIGLALAFFTYRRGLPLTIRSSLTPLFGDRLSGWLGHMIDIFAVVATILGVAQTLGFGVNQFVAGMSRIGVGDWLIDADGSPSTVGIVVALAIIMGASTLSALSGVGKGIKWLSNLNMGLSIFLLGYLFLFGATLFGAWVLFAGMWDYIISLPGLLFSVERGDGIENSVPEQLAGWQGAWTVFYWAWWVAFAPFVGLFLARISKGRTIREFVLGALIVPAIMCFVWFAFAGGTAISLELDGTAGGAIFAASDGDKIFAMTNILLGNPILSWGMALIIVILLMTYLVTSADSAVLIVNTINAAGDEGPKSRPHIIFWGAALALVVGALLIAGDISAIQTAMVIGALPFSVVMVLMAIALVKAIWMDGRRERAGVPTTIPEAAEANAAAAAAGPKGGIPAQ